MSPENRANFEAEKEAIHLILTGIGDEIYSTIDACQTAQEIWEAIERLQQVNVQFLQQLKPEWLRFVTIVKQQHKLDEVSYHKLFYILKQYQKKVNELCAKRLARNANPLALVAATQANQDPYYQTSKSYKSCAPSSKPLIPTRSLTTTRHKGKKIAKSITPPSETAFEKDSDPEQAQREKDMQKNLALIAKYFKKINKPTNNNLRTSSNSRNKNLDTPLCAESQKGLRTPHTDEEVDELELEAHYSYMEKIQEIPTADSGTDSEPVEQTQKQLKKANTTLAQELKECKTILAKTSKSLGESISVWDSFLVALQNKQTEFEKYKAFNDRTINYDKLKQIVDNAWIKHLRDLFRALTAQDMEILIQTCLMPLAIKTQNDSFRFVHELKQEMHADLKYVESLEKEIDKLESDKDEFSNMYDEILQESTPLCLMAKALPTQAWLWHRRLSHLNFDYINLLSKKDVVIGLPKLKYIKDQLCSSCDLSKAKRSSFKSKAVLSSKGRLNLLHMDLCGLMRVSSINGKKYIMCNPHGSGISFLLAVGTFFTGSGKFFCQWELYNWQWEWLMHLIPNNPPLNLMLQLGFTFLLVVASIFTGSGTSTASGNSNMAVGMPCAFYSQQSSPKLDAPSAFKFSRIK
nr:retrovirus-related Pol polyprotein from transposon TNT 1-94 [Tanacetum cinerariifolium]